MLISKTILKKIFSEFSRFAVVGVINTIINYGVFISFLSIFNVIFYLSGAIGFISGAISGFFLNRYWTFNSNVSLLHGSTKYFAIQILCLCIHIIVQLFVTKILMVQEVYSQIAGIAVTTFVNFVLSRKFVFNK
jgi:putative flippase GtrA